MTYKAERITKVSMPITTQELYEKESRGSLNFRLKKQRKRGLWSPEQKSQLFKSMIENEVTTMMSMRDTEGWSDEYDLSNENDRQKLIDELKDKDRELEMLDGNQKSGIIAEIYRDEVKCKPGVAYVDIDGTGKKHRVEFGACTWSQLKEIKNGKFLRNNFDNHEWVFTVYHKNMSNEEKGQVMRTIDNGVKMIDEELRNTFNAYGIDAIANFLWQSDSDNKYTKDAILFEKCKFTENDISRYKVNDYIIKCIHKISNKRNYGEYCFVNTNTSNLFDMVANDLDFNSKPIVDEMLNDCKDKFDLIHKLLSATGIFDGHEKQKISNPSKLNLYFDIVCALEFKYGEYNKDWNVKYAFFGPALLKVIDKLSDRKLNNDPDMPTPFEDLLGKHTPWEIRKKVALVLNELEEMGSDLTGLTILDKNRTVSKEVLYKVWKKQNEMCPIRKIKIPFEKCVAGHKTAFRNGGQSIESNTVAISKEFNNYQGAMNWEPFLNEMIARGIAK